MKSSSVMFDLLSKWWRSSLGPFSFRLATSDAVHVSLPLPLLLELELAHDLISAKHMLIRAPLNLTYFFLDLIDYICSHQRQDLEQIRILRTNPARQHDTKSALSKHSYDSVKVTFGGIFDVSKRHQRTQRCSNWSE